MGTQLRPIPPQKWTQSPIFCPCLLWPNGRPSQLLLSTCVNDCRGENRKNSRKRDSWGAEGVEYEEMVPLCSRLRGLRSVVSTPSAASGIVAFKHSFLPFDSCFTALGNNLRKRLKQNISVLSQVWWWASALFDCVDDRAPYRPHVYSRRVSILHRFRDVITACHIEKSFSSFTTAKTSGKSNLTTGRIAVANGRFNCIRQVEPVRNPHATVLPWAHRSPQSKRHLGRLNCFCRVHYCDRSTDHATPSAIIGRIYTRSTAMRPNNRQHMTY